MDEQTLAEQIAKTGNVMDLCRNETWVRESARIEVECDGRIEAGLAVKSYAQAKHDSSLDPVRQGLQRQMRVQSILFAELRCWIEEWDIGIAVSATYTEARELVRAHLRQPTPELEAWVKAVLIEDDQKIENAEKPVRAETRTQLSEMMTAEDWKTLARVAADAAANIVSSSVIKASQGESCSKVAA